MYMSVEIRTEAAQFFFFWEYINRIFFTVYAMPHHYLATTYV